MSSVCHVCEDNVNCLDFHPFQDLLLSSSILGRLEIFKVTDTLHAQWSNERTHEKSIRVSAFFRDGREVISGSSDKTVALTDVTKNECTWRGKGHKDAVNALCTVNDGIATGDDDGEIRLWDLRSKKCSLKISEFQDSVSDLLHATGHELLAICCDQIGSFDLRNGKLIALSDNVEDEFLTMQIVKGGKKVICGTQSGSLCFFSYGFWGDINDMIIVNKETVNGIAKMSEDMVCTSGDDGEIHIVSIHPNSVVGTLKNYKRLGTPKSTDSLVVNHDKTLLAFVGDLERIYVTSTLEVHSDQQDDFFNDL